MEKIFVSSVQKELQPERFVLRDFVHNNDLLRQFFRVFLFEDLPPTDRKPDSIYIDEVAKCSIYVGLYGNEYGWEDKEGLSPTEKEYRAATEQHKRRFIFIKGRNDTLRTPKMHALIQKAGDELCRKRFDDIDEMQRLLYGSLIQYLQDKGFIAVKDFDAAPCTEATLQDISAERVRHFIGKARDERHYALPVNTSPDRALAHLNLLSGQTPTKGAILLFSDKPERFFPSAEVMCLHFHGVKIAKPIPNQQVYRGSLFDVVDKTVDFVMGALTRSVKPSAASPASAVAYEVPYPVIREAVVNAIAHRNYASKSAVQVMVFTDRIEVWNPGGLPEDLTVEQLRIAHSSVPRNRLICEPLFLAHYIERAGTGTLDMIRLCTEAGLPEPQFRDEGERFVVVIWRDWLTETTIASFGLNDRQRVAIAHVRKTGKITNAEFQNITEATRKTAARDLNELVKKKLFVRQGEKRGTFYVLVSRK